MGRRWRAERPPFSRLPGLLKPSAGEVETFGSCGYMLQKDELFPWRTIEKNIFLPLEIKKQNTAENRERARALAVKYGLGDFLTSYPSELSGGMRQRAALIRTLATDPDILGSTSATTLPPSSAARERPPCSSRTISPRPSRSPTGCSCSQSDPRTLRLRMKWTSAT